MSDVQPGTYEEFQQLFPLKAKITVLVLTAIDIKRLKINKSLSIDINTLDLHPSIPLSPTLQQSIHSLGHHHHLVTHVSAIGLKIISKSNAQMTSGLGHWGLDPPCKYKRIYQ